MLTDPEVDCVFCDKSVYDHSNFETRECLIKASSSSKNSTKCIRRKPTSQISIILIHNFFIFDKNIIFFNYVKSVL